MPYNFTHALVGLTALNQTSQPVRIVASRRRDAFLIGTMGPDPYFGDSRPKPLFSACREPLAENMHALDARVLFASMFRLSAENETLEAYTLGFLCHFLLDSIAHPYIEARFPGKAHSPAEIQFDLMMTDRTQSPGVPVPPKRFYRTKRIRELDTLHAKLCAALFDIQTAGDFARSFRKWILINTLSYDPDNRKLRFFGALERLLHKPGVLTGLLVAHHPDPNDRLNAKHDEWRAPWEPQTPRTESFPDLFDDACREAPALLDAALHAMRTNDMSEALRLIGPRRMDARPL
jgi:hypothetical protein